MIRCFTVLAVAALTTACGGADPTRPGPTPLTTLEQSSKPGAWTAESARAVSSPGQALGINQEHRLVLAASAGIFTEVRGTLEDRPLYVGTGENPNMGVTRMVHPKSTGGAWLATDQGLYSVERHFVTRSPLSDQMSDVLHIADVAHGDLKGLWVVSTQGLWLKTERNLEQVNPHLSRPKHIAVDGEGRFAVLTAQTNLVVLSLDQGTLQTLDIDLDTGTIFGVVGTADAVWLATDNGLFKTDGQNWHRYPLGAQVTEIAADPTTGAIWARIPSALIQVSGDILTRFPTNPDETSLAIDRLGDVHSLAAGALLRRGTGATDGEPVTFAKLKPWLQEHCSQCHSNQTADFEDYTVFAERAEDALARVRTGDMPRCGGGVRCAPQMTLSPSDYAVLEQWVRDGAPE